MKPTKEEFLQRAKDYAISRGGECLSTEYVSAKTKTQWKCGNEDHPIFETSFQIVSSQTWCTLCAIEINAKKATFSDGLDRAKAHAAKNGGECLSTEYKNARTNLQWKCKNDHIWESNLDHAVGRDRWCQQCAYDKALEKKFDVLAEEYALAKGGYAIVPIDRKVKTATNIIWKCDNENHKEWQATYRNVVEQKGWCPYCAGKFSPEEYLEKAKDYAISKNWICESNIYLKQSSLLLWNCSQHGKWQESYRNVVDRQGGCRQCREKLSPEEYLAKAKEYAILNGGKCISDKYTVQNNNLIWECSKHGKWESDYGNIVLCNRWCPTCFKENRNNEMLQKAIQYAKDLQGECLTTILNSAKDIFEWKCNNISHPAWKSKYNTVLGNKSWCPECGIYYHKENQCRKLLEYLLGFSLEKARPKWNINPRTNNLLELDGYNIDNKIAFEYQGRHHYQDNVFKNANQTLEVIQFKDSIKAQHCREQGITLIIIDGRKKRDTAKRMIKFLQELLHSYNLDYKTDIDLDEVEKIYNAARIEKCDNSTLVDLD